jgi:hypothetical protein
MKNSIVDVSAQWTFFVDALNSVHLWLASSAMFIAIISLDLTLLTGVCKHRETFFGVNANFQSIYCSAATKEILLRLEKSAVRLNHARGILENPQLQTYRHLEKKLKPIPLDTPTVLELRPGLSIRVTLLDANHCVGAVMFRK